MKVTGKEWAALSKENKLLLLKAASIESEAMWSK